MSSLVDSSTKKRKRKPLDDKLCHFCQSAPTALVVRVPAIRSRKASPAQTYCLLHYYTTNAVRLNSNNVSIQDPDEVNRQLPAVQALFAEAYVQLQQELAQESARSFSRHQDDPLAILHDLNKSRTKKPSLAAKTKHTSGSGGGGFMQSIPLPSRLVKTQQQQANAQREMIRRMNSSASKKPSKLDLSKRRKGSRKSIWNMVMDDDGSTAKEFSAKSTQPRDGGSEQAHGIACTCGSKTVSVVGSSSSRNQEATKGEIWGNKDRGDETVTRYMCGSCARTWNEEE